MAQASGVSRRNLLRGAAGISAGLVMPSLGRNGAYAAGTEKLKVGVIGTGKRGTEAAINCLEAAPAVEIVALGDLFEDRLDSARKRIEGAARGGGKPKGGRPPRIKGKVKIAKERCFTGFDAFQHVIDCGVDLVILATPPGFRPQHLAAAVKAGKHVFMEKPVAVDPTGVRSVIASAELADRKNLTIVAGTQRRHHACYVDTVKHIHGGDIGEIVTGQCYWNQGTLWVRARQEGWTDAEWQCRNWLYYTWLSGDHIVEQHIHNLDVMNWAIGATPVKAMGMGGRQARTGAEHGNVFDHFTVEYEYPGGVRVTSMARQTRGTTGRVAERVVGTKGVSNCANSTWGETTYRSKARGLNAYVQEHKDLVDSILGNEPLNEGRRVAESTMTAILGRMSAYTGREISWDWAMKASKLDLMHKDLDFGPLGVRPVAVPGTTPLV